MLNGLLLATIFTSFQPAHAVTQLGSTTITFNTSGSPNTIAGTWSAPALDVKAGDYVEYFSLEILDVESSFGTPVSFSFLSYFPGDSRSLSFAHGCPNGLECVGLPTKGSISTVNVNSTNQFFALDFLYRLDPDNSRYTQEGNATVVFSSGGIYATATGSVHITAFGVAQAIPEPETYAMILAGLGLLGWRTRKRI